MKAPELGTIDHRPWPLPAGPWTWQQQWYDLLFAHWPIAPEVLRPLIPPELVIDTFDGSAWIGVVPFRMHIRRRGVPGIPTARHFPELNVRTYVRWGDKAGVWFFSLDAASRLAVWGARTFFHLPYFHADMNVDNRAGSLHYRSVRRGRTPARLVVRYQPTGEVSPAKPGSLDHWLTERYCLFCQSASGAFYCGDIHHAPWPLQPAEAEIEENTMLTPLGVDVPTANPLLHFAKSIDVALWPLEVMGG